MQSTSIEGYPNSTGWNVFHNPDNQLYEIKNERGRKMSSTFTDRRFAERHLKAYLDKMHSVNKTKEAKSGNKQAPASSNRVPGRTKHRSDSAERPADGAA